ncbi:MAG: hypothetical protein V8S74_02845 [Lachnospirales bacterium]
MIKMVISPEYFGNNDKEKDIREQIKRLGAYGVTIDEETGFVSAFITQDKYDDFVIGLKKRVENIANSLVGKYKGVISVKYNSDYTVFDVTFSKLSKKERKDIVFDLQIASATYQVISGIPQNDASIKVNFYNNDNKLVECINTESKKEKL